MIYWYSNFCVFLGKRDEVVIKVQREHGARGQWWFNQQGAQDEILLDLHSPVDAVIGHYHLAVLVMSPDGRIVERADKISFHVLFNPWCRGKTKSQLDTLHASVSCECVTQSSVCLSVSVCVCVCLCVYKMIWFTSPMRVSSRSMSWMKMELFTWVPGITSKVFPGIMDR